jgi:hypothetical protein
MSSLRPSSLFLLSFMLFFLFNPSCASPDEESINRMIAAGDFTEAREAIRDLLRNSTTLTPVQRLHWEFEMERMDRIKLDFSKAEQEVREFVGENMPSVTDDDYERFEASGALEVMTIDGEKRYFNSAARNLFRIDAGARAVWREQHANEPADTGLAGDAGLNEHIAQVMDAAITSGKLFVKPVRMRVSYSIAVKGGEVPEGEIIRCWLPFPREIPGRQGEIHLIATDPDLHIIADNAKFLQRTVYLEKPSAGDAKTTFSVQYEYVINGVYVPVDPERITAPDLTGELARFVSEEPPHIVFTPELRTISREIVGEETNPLRVARKLFAWVDGHIPWASAREYSTVPDLSMYALENRHGDCGMQTMLFITLCRLNGIPARWQSGWEFRPPSSSMHDWGMIYFAPYGWVPMDATYGVRHSDNEAMKYFYVNGMDSYRLIFNDAFSQPLYPAKIFPRSETVDLQRGEVEWRGGNLYFDRWEWQISWEKIN